MIYPNDLVESIIFINVEIIGADNCCLPQIQWPIGLHQTESPSSVQDGIQRGSLWGGSGGRWRGENEERICGVSSGDLLRGLFATIGGVSDLASGTVILDA